MRALWFVALYVGLGASFFVGQQSAPSMPPKPETDDIASIGALEKIGPGVSPPVVLYIPTAKFTKAARKANYQGVVVLSTIVNEQGLPQNVHVVQSLGMGLDENAVEAVKKYRFKPAMKNGKPVPVMINVEINFHLY
jgi:TonB family protein